MLTGYWSQVMCGGCILAKSEATQYDSESLIDEEMRLANAYLFLLQTIYNPQAESAAYVRKHLAEEFHQRAQGIFVGLLLLPDR